MASFNIRFWFKFSLINFLVVAILGILMRYKIGFEFPFFNQKYIQHAHSHFAFSAWVSQLLMAYLIQMVQQSNAPKQNPTVYVRMLWVNMVLAYGMLISFAYQGYGLFSITFSTLSILWSFYFCFTFWLHLRGTDIRQKSWFYAALFFNILSTAGTLGVTVMMASKNINQEGYLASVYWYLHFQYNGWFFFAIVGLFIHYLLSRMPDIKISAWVFKLFALSCIPAFGLSVLWAKLPLWLYIIVAIAAVIQVVAWMLLLNNIRTSAKSTTLFSHEIGYFLFLYIAITVSLRLLLQLGSVMPELSQLAFGFRPVVIAYLHLILLAIISMFLISYAVITGIAHFSKIALAGIIIISVAIFLNELVLAAQGIASFSYTLIPYVNEMLFLVSLIIMIGIITFIYSQIAIENRR